jgi:hypothetical protein
LHIKAATGKHRPPHKRHYIAAFIACGGFVLLSFGCSLLIVWACAVNRYSFYVLGVLSRRFNSIDSVTGSELSRLEGIPPEGERRQPGEPQGVCRVAENFKKNKNEIKTYLICIDINPYQCYTNLTKIKEV